MGLDPVLYEEGYEGVVRRKREAREREQQAREKEQEAREKAYRMPRSSEHAGEIYRLAVNGFTYGGRAAARERIEVWAKEAGSEEIGSFLAQYGLDPERYGAVQRSDGGGLIAA